MKNNLPWFQHDNDARNHPKMKALIARFGYAGYGQFWALNEIISGAEGARLDISRRVNKLCLAENLRLSPDDFDAFLAFLTDPEIDLANLENGILTTDRTTESYQSVEKARLAERERKSGKRDFPPGKDSFPPGKRDFPPGKDNRADKIRAKKNSLSDLNSYSSPENSKSGQLSCAPAPQNSEPSRREAPDTGLQAFALERAKERGAGNPEAMARKLVKEPDVIAAYEAQEAQDSGTPSAKVELPETPGPCACGGAIITRTIDRGRCNQCGALHEWNPFLRRWIAEEAESTA